MTSTVVKDQRWLNYNTSTNLDRYKYGYEVNSNRTWKTNTVHSGLDELYLYDPLNRLVTMQRGTLNAAGTAVGGALVATQLGRWIVSGNSGTHSVKLVDAATGTDLTGGSVTLSTSGATAGQYLFGRLANPLPLQASHAYYLVSQETSGGDQWYDDNTTITATGDLTVNNSEYYSTSYHSNTSGAHSYGPVNFTYGPDQPAITAQSLGTLRNNFAGWVGFKFTTASGTPGREMSWGLDSTGNWSTFVTKTSGTVDLNQTRTSNSVNEITDIVSTPSWAKPLYDAAGNMTTMPQPATPTSSFTAVYDAWNRMVKISSGGTTVATYAYDGRNRRIIKYTTSSSETRHFYYTNDWQDVEEQTGATSPTMERQYVWGIRYIDELVCRDRTSERYYAMQNANFNVTAICDTSAAVQERYRYDPYGTVTYMNASWGVLSASAKAWQISHQGLLQDAETALLYNRDRILHPIIGGFAMRDPVEYLDGASLYTYARGNPMIAVDPSGDKCQIAPYCGKVFHGLGTHCGIYMLYNGGTWSIDGSGGGHNTIKWKKGMAPWGMSGPFTTYPDSVCACIKPETSRWNALKVPRHELWHNSNWTLHCLGTKCGFSFSSFPGITGEPVGYSDTCCLKYSGNPLTSAGEGCPAGCIEWGECPCP